MCSLGATEHIVYRQGLTYRMEYSARIAAKDDKKNIAILCRRAMGKKDYVIGILDKTIAAGGLFLALDRERLIGVANFQKVADGSAWLSMARTDPDYRGKRVAGFLQKVMALHARHRGIRRTEIPCQFK